MKSAHSNGRRSSIVKIYDNAAYPSLSFEASCATKRDFRRNNQKPQRRDSRGQPPWIRLLYAHAGLVAQDAALLRAAQRGLPAPSKPAPPSRVLLTIPDTDDVASAQAAYVYTGWLRRLRILERFPQPDWSIADKWIAKELLRCGMSAPQAGAILRDGSPGFPRRHSHPEDYLGRTLARAASELAVASFPRRAPGRGPS